MEQRRVKFATQVDSALLDELRVVAKKEGRQIQYLVEEAIEALLDKKNGSRPSRDVMELADKFAQDYAETLKYLAQ